MTNASLKRNLEHEFSGAVHAPLAKAIAGALLGVGVGSGLGPGPAFGQPPRASQSAARDAGVDRNERLEEILVTERKRERYRVEDSALTKLTESLRETPQSITTLPKELLEDRGAMSLNDALRNVPGITLGAGEFSWQGNNPSIRGFSSRNDMFLDGMRDFGSYSRDPFDLETIEVLEGPSSMIFGRGSTGGVINQVSKSPLPERLRSVSINGGTDSTARLTADINQPLESLGRGGALRVNALAHHSEVAGRDGAESRRYGFAPSLALGLGSATELTLSYLKQVGDDRPDYGLPWFAGRPAPVPRRNFYGFASDYIETDADVLTARLRHEASDRIETRAQLRYADYRRESRLTEPLITDPVTAATPPAGVTVDRNVFKGESDETMLQAQADFTLHLGTGGINHALVAGLEAGRETSAPTFGFGTGVVGTNLLRPNGNEPFTATGTAPRLEADTVGESLAIYALDTLKLGESWEIVAGLRWDRFAADYEAVRFAVDGDVTGADAIERVDREVSYRAAIVYKTAARGTIYLGWGTSFNPSAESLSFITSGRGLGIGNAFLSPEQNESWELGTKWDFSGEALSFNAALFRIAKDNARVPDPANPGFNMLAGEQRVDGLAVNVVGRIADRWQITGGYTHLDGEVVETAPGAAPVGSSLTHAPDDSLSLWFDYAFSDRFDIGAGARYVDERLAQNVPPIKVVPEYWSFDAMARYVVSENLTLKLNLTNLTDEYYFDRLHPWHVVPGPGFAAVVAVNVVY